MMAFLANTELPSYRDLPTITYHIQWKFRDEPRPRGGLLRGREFYMKDAYSFDASDDGLRASYKKMETAYIEAFRRCGLAPVQIEADPGAIGGTVNHEFTEVCPSGEDTFVACENCDYSANTEVAAGRPPHDYDFGDPPPAPEKVHTPGKVKVDEVSQLLGVEPRQLIKSLIFTTSDGLVCALVPGDRELNEVKLARVLGGRAELLADEEFARRGIAKGFSGPVGIGMRIVADGSLEGGRNLVGGANEADQHLTGIVPGRDFAPDAWTDLILVEEGDVCDRCGGKLTVQRGIEVGHIFQLVGADYLTRLGATFTDEDGKTKPFVMGSYGFGVSRAVAAVVEVHHDDRGIAWPKAVAPYEVCVLLLTDDEKAHAFAALLESDLEADGVGVVLDDRPGVSAGVKFTDADLIGYPLQVVVGKTFVSSGKLEAKVRSTQERSEIEASVEAVREALAGCP
jgi:prolyl-tRNA synthetase